jgi:hypothetical protein
MGETIEISSKEHSGSHSSVKPFFANALNCLVYLKGTEGKREMRDAN